MSAAFWAASSVVMFVVTGFDPGGGAPVVMWIATIGAVVVGLAVAVGRQIGLSVLWAVVLAFWLVRVVGVLIVEEWALMEAGRHLPAAFTAWITMAFPLAIATEAWLHISKGARPPLRSVWPHVALIMITVPMVALAPVALDVGGTPLNSKLLIGIALVTVLPAPWIWGVWIARRLLNPTHTVSPVDPAREAT